MNKFVAVCFALCLCVVVFGSTSIAPVLLQAVSRPTTPTPPAPRDLQLAVLANPAAAKASAPEASPRDSADTIAHITTGTGAVAGSSLAPAQAAAGAPAMAPASAPLALPTLTPTPQPVVVAAAVSAPAPQAASSVPTGCTVSSPPAALGLDPAYTKYCEALGIPIVSSGEVPDAALQRAWEIVTQMLTGVPQAEEIRASITVLATRIGIIGAHQVPTDMPEHRTLYAQFPGVDWNTRARGIAATPDIPLLSIAEENLLCYPNDQWIGQNVLVHEFAHTMKNMGLDFVKPGFQAELEQSYQHALDAGLWLGTYVISDVEEYWAEGVRLYFQAAPAGVPGGQVYPANSRAELQVYDPDLYRLVENTFGPRDPIAPCPIP